MRSTQQHNSGILAVGGERLRRAPISSVPLRLCGQPPFPKNMLLKKRTHFFRFHPPATSNLHPAPCTRRPLFLEISIELWNLKVQISVMSQPPLSATLPAPPA